jgi:NADH-quinone oxidoreductase subunit J
VSENVKLLLLVALGAFVMVVIAGLSWAYADQPLETGVFYILALGMMGSSLLVATSRNIVRAATALLGTLGSAAGMYFLCAANLLGAIQLIVYAGGILILIVFGVMLTARNPAMKFQPKSGEVFMSVLVGLILFGGIVTMTLRAVWPTIPNARPSAEVARVWLIGRELLTTYLVPFEVISVLLLAVMIGAAYLARPEKR